MDWLVMCLVLISLETSGNPKNMIGDRGQAIGIMQIHKIVVDEYNTDHGTSYNHEDCRNPDLSVAISRWYLDKWGSRYQKETGNKASAEVLYRIWNGGPDGWKNDSTELRGLAAELSYTKFELMGRERQLEQYRKWVQAFKDAQPVQLRKLRVDPEERIKVKNKAFAFAADILQYP